MTYVVDHGRPPVKEDDRDHQRNEPNAENGFNLAHKVEKLSAKQQLVPFAIALLAFKRFQSLDCTRSDIVIMSEPLKSGNKKRVHDRDEKDDRCRSIKGLFLNPSEEFTAEDRDRFVLIAVAGDRKFLAASGFCGTDRHNAENQAGEHQENSAAELRRRRSVYPTAPRRLKLRKLRRTSRRMGVLVLEGCRDSSPAIHCWVRFERTRPCR